MWILKNSKDLLEYIQSSSLSSCNCSKTLDFSVLYIAIPHSKLKERIRELVQLWSIEKNDQCRCKYLVLGRDTSNVAKNTLILPKSSLKLISSICSSFWLTTQLLCLVNVYLNRRSAYLWVHLVLINSPTCSFICTRQGILKKNEKKLAWTFNFTFRYIDDVLSLNNSMFGYFVARIYPV